MLFIWHFEETRKPFEFNLFKLSYMTSRCIFGNDNFYEVLYVPDPDFCHEIRYHQLLLSKNCIFNIVEKIDVMEYWAQESNYVECVYVRNDVLLKPFPLKEPICEADEAGIKFCCKTTTPKATKYSVRIEASKFCPHTRIPHRGYVL